MKRTIVCLAAKRSGTTAIHHVFAKHPQVRICHPDQDVENFEPDFWYAASLYFQARDHHASKQEQLSRWRDFVGKLSIANPRQLATPDIDVRDLFKLWDELLDIYGPVVFDKSPKYLARPDALRLLRQYSEGGKDVRFFALVRNPRDVIASQYGLWRDERPEATFEFRAQEWVRYYDNLEQFRSDIGPDKCPVFVYEEIAQDPGRHLPHLLAHCGLENDADSYAHIRPTVSDGRYPLSAVDNRSRWSPGAELCQAAARYGYDLGATRSQSSVKLAPPAKQKLGKFHAGFKRVATSVVSRLAPGVRQTLLSDLIEASANGLSPSQMARLFCRLDTQLRMRIEDAALSMPGGHPRARLCREGDFVLNRISAGLRILHADCGDGVFSRDMALWSKSTVLACAGNTLDSANWSRLESNLLSFRHVDISTEIPDFAADVIVLTRFLERRHDRSRLLRTLSGKTGAKRFFLQLPYIESRWQSAWKAELAVEWRQDVRSLVEYSTERLTAEAGEAGFKVNDYEVHWGDIWADISQA